MSQMTGKPGGSTSPLTVVGLRPGDEPIYRTVLRLSGTSRDRLTEATGLTLAELDEILARLAAVGLVRLDQESVVALPPAEVIGQLISGEAERLHREAERIDALRDLLPSLVSEHLAAARPRGGEVDVYAVENEEVVPLLRRLAEESEGDMMWFRPDQWRLPVTLRVDEMVRDLMAAGHRSRVIYPARVLEEAPHVVSARATAGEQVRIVESVPTRIAIFGGTSAFLSDRWGANTGRRLVVREHSLVGALGALFESVWERGMAVPGMDAGVQDSAGQRRLLLHQLTRGAKDEQIARTLGVSLRTVRRRIADIMEELGAESRFQAGVEAVRRGWL